MTPTKIQYVYQTENGEYAVCIRFKRYRYRRTGFQSRLEAVIARDKTLAILTQSGEKARDKQTAPVQCIRCTKPHMPGSRYCENHARRQSEPHSYDYKERKGKKKC